MGDTGITYFSSLDLFEVDIFPDDPGPPPAVIRVESKEAFLAGLDKLGVSREQHPYFTLGHLACGSMFVYSTPDDIPDTSVTCLCKESYIIYYAMFEDET